MIGGALRTGSLWSQYMTYLSDVFHFNFGTDLANFPTPVSEILDQSIPWTLILVGTATVIAFLLGTLPRHPGRLAARRLAGPVAARC